MGHLVDDVEKVASFVLTCGRSGDKVATIQIPRGVLCGTLEILE